MVTGDARLEYERLRREAFNHPGAASGYELNRGWVAKAAVNEGFGHDHVLLDTTLVDMECDQTTKVSMRNVQPGPHTIVVLPAPYMA